MRFPHQCILAGLILLAATGLPAQDGMPPMPPPESNEYRAFEATADERQRRVVKILRTTDKAQVNQFVPFAFALAHVNPFQVVRFIRRPIEAEEGNWWTFVHPAQTSGVVLVNVPIWQVEPMRELMRVIDRPGLTSSAGDERKYIALGHRDPAAVAPLLSPYLTPTATVVADRPTGSLYIEDAPSGIKSALDVLSAELDTPTSQTVIRAKIYEIDLTDDGTIGLDFHAWKNGPGRNLFAVGGYAENFHNTRLDGSEGAVISPGVDVNGLPGRQFKSNGFNGAYFYDVPSAYFDFLVSKGRARVLTAPSATVLNTETATFSTGEEVLFYKVQSRNNPGLRDTPLDPLGESTVYPDNRTVTGMDSAQVGVNLQVQPIIAERSVTLAVALSVTSQLGWDDTGAPMLQTRNLSTTVRATPGAEYILGGMTRTRSIQTTRKVPVLGSLPLLGWLFGGEITTAKKTMLTIVMSTNTVDDFSGLDAAESATLASVDTVGMDAVALPAEIAGFDMMLLGRQ